MPAVAFSNNDIAVVAWTFDRHLDGCLGFAIHQIDIDANNKETVLPALARFAEPDRANLTTAQAPVQKFWWKDLFAKRGGTYQYRIVPMGGSPGATLTPLAGVAAAAQQQDHADAEPAAVQRLFQSRHHGDAGAEPRAERQPEHRGADAPHPRSRRSDSYQPDGPAAEGVTSLLDRADKGGGIIHAALYELNDPNGLEKHLQANPKSRTVILGNEQSVDPKTKAAIEDARFQKPRRAEGGGRDGDRPPARQGRYPAQQIHGVEREGAPTAVLSGSTNWTSTGLCTQTNNALVIESADVAQRYIDYWNALKADVDAANGNQANLQSPTLRGFTHKNNDSSIAKPIDLGNGVTVEVMFSPNTQHKLTKPPKETPNDMKRVFDLIDGAKQAVLFLAFDPGNNSILDAAGRALGEESRPVRARRIDQPGTRRQFFGSPAWGRWRRRRG